MKPRIVFLDAATVDYGDLDFSLFADIGRFSSFPMTRPDEAAERLAGAEIAITNKVVFDRDLIGRCNSLKLIAVAATGYNNIDIDAARGRGIAVANVPGYSTFSVAQFTMMFVLALAGNLIPYNSACHDGSWSRSPIFTMGTWPTFDLQNRVLGIMGLGAIGSEVARLADAFGMKVIALRRRRSARTGHIERLALREFLAQSDFVSLHMPLTADNRYLVNREFLTGMKRGSFLINMARGALVDPVALREALESGTIAGAAMDVMEQEPPAPGDPLPGAPNLILTPHIAWATIESRKRLVAEIRANIDAFLKGVSRNMVL